MGKSIEKFMKENTGAAVKIAKKALAEIKSDVPSVDYDDVFFKFNNTLRSGLYLAYVSDSKSADDCMAAVNARRAYNEAIKILNKDIDAARKLLISAMQKKGLENNLSLPAEFYDLTKKAQERIVAKAWEYADDTAAEINSSYSYSDVYSLYISNLNFLAAALKDVFLGQKRKK